MSQTIPPFRENILLKDFCTYGIGGPARSFLEIRTVEEMQKALVYCHKNNQPFMVLGKGSNCLFDDRGFNGVILLNKIDFFAEEPAGTFHVGAGYSFSLLGVQTARQGWGGLEFASGIPGSVGGAVYMNAGANGGETCQSLDSIDFVTKEGIFEVIPRKDLSFAYRHSPFQKRPGAIVGATFKLQHNAEARKKQIEIVTARKKSQPLSEKSAGCVFVNPVCGHAGALIDQCGLKGTLVGGAKISEIHANFLVNAAGATSQDMLQLYTLVKNRVQEFAGVELKTEVRYIPYDPEVE